jgi:hypothetical protein
VLLIAGMLLGFITALLRRAGFLEWLAITYLMVILLWPCPQGFRFLLGLYPFLIFYAATFYRSLLQQFPWRRAAAPAVLVAGILLCSGTLYKEWEHRSRHIEGPFSADMRPVIDTLRTLLPEHVLTESAKPRAMALITDRKFTINSNKPVQQNLFEMRKLGVTYYLEDRSMFDWNQDQLLKYLAALSQLDTVWHTERFTLFRDLAAFPLSSSGPRDASY